MHARLGVIGLALILGLVACSRSSDPNAGQRPLPPVLPIPSDQPAPVLTAVAPDDPTLAAVRAMLDEPARSNARFIGKTVQAGGQTLTLFYVVGHGLCVPEGCDLFVFRRNGEAFEQVGDIGFVRRPVRLLASTTNGMPNLGITVTVDGGSGSKIGGGAPHAPNEVLLPFLNDHYVGAPADYGARPSGNPAGTVVISPEDAPIAPASPSPTPEETRP